MAIEKAIHVNFNENELDKDLSELDKSFVDHRLNNGIKEKGSSCQGSEIEASNQHEPPKEAKESTRRVMRQNHPEIQTIGDPINHVQTRSSLRSQQHTALFQK